MWVEKVKKGYKFIERYKDPLTGRYKRVSIVLDKNTKQAQKQAQETLYEKIEHNIQPEQRKDITLSELVELYGKEQIKTVKIQTYDRNIGACKSIMKMLGKDTMVNNLTAGYVRRKFLDSGRKNGTLNEWLVRFKGLIRWGYKNDYVNSIKFLEKLERFHDVPKKDKIKDKFLEAEELKTLLDGMKVEKWKDLTEFLALSGLRFGEAAALLRSDIDFDNRVIHVTKTYNQAHDYVSTPKTGNSIRDVYMQDQLYNLCKKIMRDSISHTVVKMTDEFFTGTRRDHIQFDIYAKYLRENSLKLIGRKITPHTLRHTHASLLMENKIDIDSISHRLGHADSRITKEIYLHITEKLKEKENERIKNVKII